MNFAIMPLGLIALAVLVVAVAAGVVLFLSKK